MIMGCRYIFHTLETSLRTMRSPVSKKPWKRSYDRVDDDNRRPKFQPSYKRRRVERFKKSRHHYYASNSGIRERSGGRYGSRSYHATCREFSDGDGRLDSKEKSNDVVANGVSLRHGHGADKASIPREMSQQSKSCSLENDGEKVYFPWDISLQNEEPKPSIDRVYDCSLKNKEQIRRDNFGLKVPKNIHQENALKSPANHKGDDFHESRSRFNDSDRRLAFKAKSNGAASEVPLKYGAVKSLSQQSLSRSWERREDREKVSFPREISLQNVVGQRSQLEPNPSIDKGRGRSFKNEVQIKRDMVGLEVPKNILQENVLRSPANHKGDAFHAPRSRFNDSDQRLAFKAKSNDADAIEVPLKHGAVSGILKSSSQLSGSSREKQPSKGGKKVSFHPEISLQDVVSQKSRVEPKPLSGTGRDCTLDIGRAMVGFKRRKVDDSGQEMTSEAKLDRVAENRIWLRQVSDLDTLRPSSQEDVSSSPIYASQSGTCVKQKFNVEQKPAVAVTCGSQKQACNVAHSVENAARERAMTLTKVPKNAARENSLKCHAPSGDLVREKSNAATSKNTVDSHDRIIEVTTEVKRMIGSKVLKNTSEENSSKCQTEPSPVFNGDLRHQDDEKMVRSLEENRKRKIAEEMEDVIDLESDKGTTEQLSRQEVTDCEPIPGNCGHQEHLFSEKIIVVNTQAAEARVSEQPFYNDEQGCFFYVADHVVADDCIQKLKQLKDDCIVLISDRYHVHDSRKRVIKALDLFKDVYAIRFKAYKAAKQNHGRSAIQKIDVRTAMALKHEGKWVNYEGRVFVGNVPGVYIGDQFLFRAELAIVGLHHTFFAGIHYVNIQGNNYAISIVNSGRYDNRSISPDSFIYVGHGGNPGIAGNEPVDQELKYGNLALKNSRDKGVPVRVTRACPVRDEDSTAKNTKRYIYEGLFVVTRYWQERSVKHGKMVFMFEMHRMSNQPSFTPEMSVRPRRVGTWFHRQALKKGRRPFGIGRPFLNGKRTRGVFKSSLRSQAVERVVVDDVSHGKENLAIRVVSDIYAERPLPFTYTANMIYPNWYHPWVPLGCDCTNGCTDSRHCYCAFRNGGEIPYNTRGAIIKPKPVIYECGPACKCPPSCRNRVSQHGIRYHLEIFRKKPSGWGVRSRDYISSGSFICEFVGDLIVKKEAKQRIGHLQYFCPIGNPEKAIPHESCTAIAHSDEDSSSQYKYGHGYIIDAACSGNVARFINRSSSSPNLFVQNVLYEDDYEGVPHIMLFACKNILPMQEFTYDYNCSDDQSDAFGRGD